LKFSWVHIFLGHPVYHAPAPNVLTNDRLCFSIYYHYAIKAIMQNWVCLYSGTLF